MLSSFAPSSILRAGIHVENSPGVRRTGKPNSCLYLLIILSFYDFKVMQRYYFLYCSSEYMHFKYRFTLFAKTAFSVSTKHMFVTYFSRKVSLV